MNAGSVPAARVTGLSMLSISRGVFGKALGVTELAPDFLALLAAIPVILGLAIVALPKQER